MGSDQSKKNQSCTSSGAYGNYSAYPGSSYSQCGQVN
jgi:hypothetical protein